ncbi:hypothetical protein [Hymenobacter bucti]|uniref:Uncharacterized protein n=1 Tax=Hymenobacter bucti TaxID=1844114 RepID=A0ABW4QMS6_9BACT
MLTFPNNFLKHKHLLGVAVLALGLGGCEQRQAEPVSTAPLPQLQPTSYYLNAKPSTKTVIEQLDPQTMTRMDVLDGQKAADYAHDPGVKRAIVVQTK